MGHQAKGCAAQFTRVDAQQQMVHGRVADYHHFQNIVGQNRRGGTEFADQPVEAVDNTGVHPFGAVLVHHGVANAAHQIFAIRHLGIHTTGRSQQFPGAQVTKMGRHRGRANIDGNPIEIFVIAGLDAHHFGALPDRHRDGATGVGQRALQIAQEQPINP